MREAPDETRLMIDNLGNSKLSACTLPDPFSESPQFHFVNERQQGVHVGRLSYLSRLQNYSAGRA